MKGKILRAVTSACTSYVACTAIHVTTDKFVVATIIIGCFIYALQWAYE